MLNYLDLGDGKVCLMSNGATIASGTEEGLSSAAIGEALQFYYDLYNTYNVFEPLSNWCNDDVSVRDDKETQTVKKVFLPV